MTLYILFFSRLKQAGQCKKYIVLSECYLVILPNIKQLICCWKKIMETTYNKLQLIPMEFDLFLGLEFVQINKLY